MICLILSFIFLVLSRKIGRKSPFCFQFTKVKQIFETNNKCRKYFRIIDIRFIKLKFTETNQQICISKFWKYKCEFTIIKATSSFFRRTNLNLWPLSHYSAAYRTRIWEICRIHCFRNLNVGKFYRQKAFILLGFN